MITLVMAVAVAMGVSFLCSVMEAAILSINPGKLALLSRRRPRIGAVCQELKSNIEKPIAVILILNTTAHTFGAAIAGAQFDKMTGGEYIWLFSLVFTVMMVQYTEILPKTLGVRYSVFVLSCTALMLKYAARILAPVIWLVHFVNRPFERESSDASQEGEEMLEELDAIAMAARTESHITELQEQAIHQIPDLKDECVTSIMKPCAEMICISTSMSSKEVLEVMDRHRHSRYPVVDSPGVYVGVLEVRKMLFIGDADWHTLLRPATFVAPECTLLHIAENLKKLDSRLLLVRDSSGVTLGMFTTNDLLMNIFEQD